MRENVSRIRKKNFQNILEGKFADDIFVTHLSSGVCSFTHAGRTFISIAHFKEDFSEVVNSCECAHLTGGFEVF